MADSTLDPKRFIAFLKSVPSDVQFVNLMDMDHMSPEIRQLVAHPDVLQTLKDTGRDSIAIEAPVEFINLSETVRDVFKDYVPDLLKEPVVSASGGLASLLGVSSYHTSNPDKSAEYSRAEVEFMLRPLSQDIRLITPDPYILNLLDQNNPQSEKMSKLWGDISEGKCYELTNEAQKAVGDMTPDLKASENKVFDERMKDENDAVIANNIKLLSGGENGIVVYGAGHMMRSNDLDEKLSGSVSVALFPDENSRLVGSSQYAHALNDLPDYMYVISTDRVVKLEPGSKEAENYWARIPNRVTGTLPALTEQEHADCVARLPERLKPFAPMFEDVSTGELGGLPVRHIGGQPKAGQLERE